MSFIMEDHVQWRAEAVGCPGPTRFLDALKFFSNKFFKKYFLFVSQNFFFLVVHQNFSNLSLKISDDLFFTHLPEFFTSSHKFSNFTIIYSLHAPQCCIM